VEKNSNEMASIVYTSGTTGRPKGVMLSHKNIVTNAYAGAATAVLNEHDSFLSFLPLSHMFERTAGYYIPMIVGASVTYARSVLLLADDLLIIKPTALISVPRIYERVYNKIAMQLSGKPPLAQKLFRTTVEIGWQRYLYQQGRGKWQPRFLAWPLLNQLVASKIMAKLGGRLKLAICGGAPLSPEVAQTFIGLGLNLRQGYGLTETGPVISVNRDHNNIPSSIGERLEGIEVKVGDDDELLTRSDCVMLGYWNNPQATEEMIDEEGWLHTGDKAKIEGGVITITGRIKEIIVLSNGEKVPPADMEMAITMDPLFEQVMVLGEGRPYLSMLTVLNQEQADHENLSRDHAGLEAILLERVGALLKDFPGYAQIRRIHVCPHLWSIEDGLITPTLKLKRHKLLEQFSSEIAALYEGH
jgi:long-chain acyl-CoA synthetase